MLVFVLLIIVLTSCAPTPEQVQTAMTQTQMANPTPYPTQTPYPTPVSIQTPIPQVTAAQEFRVITWAQLVDFILDDHTNWNVWTEQYNCVNFSLDLEANARSQNIDSWIVAVVFENIDEGHAFVAFPTSDRGEIWIEPQSDDAYAVAEVGEYLCLLKDPSLCIQDGKIIKIIQPATCDGDTHACW